MNSISRTRSVDYITSAMARVYSYMGLSIVVSMLVAMGVAANQEVFHFFNTGITHWVVLLAPLAAVFVLVPYVSSSPSKEGAILALIGFAVLMGLSLSVVFVVYTTTSIVSAFMGAAILFGVMSFYGFFTKKDLNTIGRWAFVGLIAVIIASVINIFIGNTVAQLVISAISILVFLALTAYDTQKIREMLSYEPGIGTEVLGALSLYLDFINLFVQLLSIIGNSDD